MERCGCPNCGASFDERVGVSDYRYIHVICNICKEHCYTHKDDSCSYVAEANDAAMRWHPRSVSKTVITITVLHHTDDVLPDEIEDVLYETREGYACGWETDRVTTLVPPDRVKSELIAVGNDGTFFDDAP